MGKRQMKKHKSDSRNFIMKIMVKKLTTSFLQGLRRKHCLKIEELSKLVAVHIEEINRGDSLMSPSLIRKYENGWSNVPGRHLHIICACVDEESALAVFSMDTCILYHKARTLAPMKLGLFAIAFWVKHTFLQKTYLTGLFFRSINRRDFNLKFAS